jgi:hypothetical protein
MTPVIGSEFADVIRDFKDIRQGALRARVQRVAFLRTMVGNMEAELERAKKRVSELPAEIGNVKRAIEELEAMTGDQLLAAIAEEAKS